MVKLLKNQKLKKKKKFAEGYRPQKEKGSAPMTQLGQSGLFFFNPQEKKKKKVRSNYHPEGSVLLLFFLLLLGIKSFFAADKCRPLEKNRP